MEQNSSRDPEDVPKIEAEDLLKLRTAELEVAIPKKQEAAVSELLVAKTLAAKYWNMTAENPLNLDKINISPPPKAPPAETTVDSTTQQESDGSEVASVEKEATQSQRESAEEAERAELLIRISENLHDKTIITGAETVDPLKSANVIAGAYTEGVKTIPSNQERASGQDAAEMFRSRVELVTKGEGDQTLSETPSESLTQLT